MDGHEFQIKYVCDFVVFITNEWKKKNVFSLSYAILHADDFGSINKILVVIKYGLCRNEIRFVWMLFV